MNKKVVVLGGGTGLSTLLKGLKMFPVDITAIVSVSDDGRSTGRLRDEFNIPAVGDVRQVLVALSETEPLVEKLLNYRFNTTSDLNGHTVGNLLLTAASNITGNMSDGVEALSKVLNLRGKVVPLTEDNVTLMGRMEDDSIIEGEHNITECDKKIKEVFYKDTPEINSLALKAIRESNLIILSMGSVFTSIIPNLICKSVIDEIDKSNANIIYVCNMMTQPGETDGFKVSDHVRLLNSYLGTKKIHTVLVNNKNIPKKLLDKYANEEQKDQVVVDFENLNDTKVIASNFFQIQNNMIRHDSLKLSLAIFSYLLSEKSWHTRL